MSIAALSNWLSNFIVADTFLNVAQGLVQIEANLAAGKPLRKLGA